MAKGQRVVYGKSWVTFYIVILKVGIEFQLRFTEYLLPTRRCSRCWGRRGGHALLNKIDRAPALTDLMFLWEMESIYRVQINEKISFRYKAIHLRVCWKGSCFRAIRASLRKWYLN